MSRQLTQLIGLGAATITAVFCIITRPPRQTRAGQYSEAESHARQDQPSTDSGDAGPGRSPSATEVRVRGHARDRGSRSCGSTTCTRPCCQRLRRRRGRCVLRISGFLDHGPGGADTPRPGKLRPACFLGAQARRLVARSGSRARRTWVGWRAPGAPSPRLADTANQTGPARCVYYQN